ncbi:MAG: HD domain-containing phosphohydrolase [Bacillota bacterium]
MSRILIVDDQKSNIALLKTQLKGHEIIEAEDGRTALKKLRTEKPDLILLDLMMPGPDGYSVLSIIRNAEETRRIPVILITARNSMDEKIKSLEKGADDFISKPFNPHELVARVNSLLRVRDLQREMESFQELVYSLILSRESRDAFSQRHSERTAYYAEKLGQKFFFVRDQIKSAALLHDIGKAGISDGIFLKPGMLEPHELEIIKYHPVAGEKMCLPVLALKPVLPYIRHHHERYDGSGYPDRLEGSDIPLGARVLAVADAFDALLSPRPYRKAYSQDEALQILRDGAGTQWDPKVVSTFCELILNDTSVADQQSIWYLEKHKIID